MFRNFSFCHDSLVDTPGIIVYDGDVVGQGQGYEETPNDEPPTWCGGMSRHGELSPGSAELWVLMGEQLVYTFASKYASEVLSCCFCKAQ